MTGWRRLLYFAPGVVLAAALVLTFLFVSARYRTRIREARLPIEQVTAVVAARTLHPGVAIHADDLYLLVVDPSFLPSGSFVVPDHVIGRRPAARILPNELVRAERLADPDSGHGLNGLLPAGTRAVSVEIAGAAGLAGLLHPGNTVDVLATVRPDDPVEGGETYGSSSGPKEAETHTLLQSVYVLGVNGLSERDDRGQRDGAVLASPSVTLLVNPDQAESLAHFDTVGELTLTLRNDLDQAIVAIRGPGVDETALRALFDVGPAERESARAAPRPRPSSALVEETLLIIRGPNRTVETPGAAHEGPRRP